MHPDLTRALAGFETRTLRDAVVVLSGLVVLGGWAAIALRKRAKARRALRKSLDQTAQTAQEGNELVEQQTLETLLLAVESGRATLEPWMGSGAKPRRTADARQVSAAPASKPAAQKEDRPDPASAPANGDQPLREVSWWAARNPADQLAQRMRAEGLKPASWQPAENRGGEKAAEAAKPPEKNGAPPRLPRLTELRGTMFSKGIKELDHSRHGAELAAQLERMTGPLPSLETLLNQARRRNGTLPESATAKTAPPAPETEAAPESGSEKSAQQAGAQPAEGEPAAKSSKPVKAARKKPNQDAGEPYEQVEILPSRRGQYKRKD